MNQYQKYFSIIITCTTMIKPVFAITWSTANCTNRGGTIISANTLDNNPQNICTNLEHCTGGQFCQSRSKMNWWSAYTWCKSHGGNLVSLSSACPRTVTESGRVCPNLHQKITGNVGVWTNDIISDGVSWGIYYWVGSSTTLRQYTLDDDTHLALCE